MAVFANTAMFACLLVCLLDSLDRTTRRNKGLLTHFSEVCADTPSDCLSSLEIRNIYYHYRGEHEVMPGCIPRYTIRHIMMADGGWRSVRGIERKGLKGNMSSTLIPAGLGAVRSIGIMRMMYRDAVGIRPLEALFGRACTYSSQGCAAGLYIACRPSRYDYRQRGYDTVRIQLGVKTRRRHFLKRERGRKIV